eukprot:Sspe_Gene.52423::Locus_29055_Transcript_1_1_Confidence_1.000_Length_512::g.52423::m.52423
MESAKAVWAHHMEAFRRQDVEEAVKDYADDSVLRLYNQSTNETKVCRGPGEIAEALRGLFASLHDRSDLTVLFEDVEDRAVGQLGQVFMGWRCPASGCINATDTAYISPAMKIIRHNMVMQHAAK